MRRIAAVLAVLNFFFVIPVSAETRKPTVIVKVRDNARANEVAWTHSLKVKKSIARGTGRMLVVEDISADDLRNKLRGESGIEWIVENALVPLDGGEKVVPLDGGETVLPLDGGETVLPLDDGTNMKITTLLDGGETVLPLDELQTIRSAFTKIAQLMTPSRRLILQPALRKIGLYPSVLRVTGRGVIVADLDTGADTCHPVLRGIATFTFVEGADALAPENCATDATPIVPGFGHGTATASLIRTTAPEATIWAMRVFDNTGSALISDIYEAIIYAADNGANVINMSFGTTTPSVALTDAIEYARARRVVLVAAGGNSNVEPLMYPAANAGVKGVTATTNSDVKASFSNYGVQAFVSAPGYGIWVAYPNHKLKYVAGTSYSSPLTAGEATLVVDAYYRVQSGSPTESMIDASMLQGTQPIDHLNPGYETKLGRGRIYIPWALNATGLQ